MIRHGEPPEFGSRLFLVICSLVCAAATLGMPLPLSSAGRDEYSRTGTVTDRDGKPVGGVRVFAGRPLFIELVDKQGTTTDEEGHFDIGFPAAILHFYRKDFKPQTLVIKPGALDIKIIMDPANDNLIVPDCGSLSKGRKRIGWGASGLQFAVPAKSVEISGGNPDVDYVRYIIHPKSSDFFLELWFGGMAMSTYPEDEKFMQSTTFSQRQVVDFKGLALGLDNSGQLQSGDLWRQVNVHGSGARYQKAPPKVAAFFDQIINSACLAPYPNNR